ncbi:MAG TPA: PD-(D/E)XK nuclease family protein [Patescibacteria group bacterium]|nr:PD-(D/E)XK nuclease family protein [Patescibacteria group bacterium]
MSNFYKGRNQKNCYDPESKQYFKLSRSKIDLFVECPRCFYLDRRLGLGRPPGFPFNLNSAVDHLLKKEFDIHRAGATTHPLMSHYGVDAVPFSHPLMDQWRENFKGIEFLHEPTNLLITGAVDDIWQSSSGELMIVDYKATSKETEVTLDAPWQDGYKRQMEIYQWLFARNGFPVAKTGYFVYCNGKRDAEAFDGKLEFEVKLIPYEGATEWIESVLEKIKGCLDGGLPSANTTCDYCLYRKEAAPLESSLPAIKQEMHFTERPKKSIKAKQPAESSQRSLFGLY